MAKENTYPSKVDKELFEAILELKDAGEATKFFRDLLTIPEIKDLAKRWQIVKLLNRGLTYSEVAEKVKASTSTVSRVAHWLFRGTGGYKLILSRLKNK
jgi:TrpR-related protein YerC/YecD